MARLWAQCLALTVLPSLAQLPTPGSGKPGEKHVFGKYFKDDFNDDDNSFWIWRPHGAVGQVPAVLYYHPGGFVGMAPAKIASETIDAWTNFGFAYISIGYRLTAHRYYYNSTDGVPTTQKLEEFIEVSEQGMLSLSTNGKTLADWKIYAGRQDVITKCMYDGVQSLNYIIENAVSLGVDPQRLIFQTGSAGTGISNYLTYVYQPQAKLSFHTKALIFSSAQLVYPVEGLMQKTWELIADHMEMGSNTPLDYIFDALTCKQQMCNIACPGFASDSQVWQYDLCNTTWNQARYTEFCSTDGFETKTISDGITNGAYIPANWPEDTWDYHENMKKLWYNDLNIAAYPQGADYVLVSNHKNGTGTEDLPHLPVFAQGYATVCKKAGCKYAVYYTNYKGMMMDPSVPQVESLGSTWNYESNFKWRESYMIGKDAQVASLQEQILFGCMSVAFVCDLSTFNFAPNTPEATIDQPEGSPEAMSHSTSHMPIFP